LISMMYITEDLGNAVMELHEGFAVFSFDGNHKHQMNHVVIPTYRNIIDKHQEHSMVSIKFNGVRNGKGFKEIGGTKAFSF